MRLFVAVNFDEPFKNAVLEYQSKLKKAASGNFSRPENLHITLAFIGEVSNASSALKAVKSVSFEPFELALSKAGNFGSLYWLGVNGGKSAHGSGIYALAEKVRASLKLCGVSFDPKPFKPHITLAREVEFHAPFDAVVPQASMRVERISLMKSERINGRLVYSELK